MGIPLSESTDNQENRGMLLGSEPPVSEYDPNLDLNLNLTVTSTSINWVETTLIEELSTDLGDLAAFDDFYDQDLGLSSLLDSPEPRVVKAPYKEGPKIGQTQIGQSQPLCHFSDDAMDTGAEELSLSNSPSTHNPGSAPGSPKGSPSQALSAPTIPEEPAEPVEVQLPTGKAHVILGSGAVRIDTDGPGRRKLALPKVLTDRQYWITSDTKVKIEETCGQTGNLKCRQCGKRFTTAR